MEHGPQGGRAQHAAAVPCAYDVVRRVAAGGVQTRRCSPRTTSADRRGRMRLSSTCRTPAPSARHPSHICTGTGLTPPTAAPGLGSPLPHLRRDWAHPFHICTGSGLIPATSAPGLGSPHLTSAPGLGSRLPHLHRDWGSPHPTSAPGLGRPTHICAPLISPPAAAARECDRCIGVDWRSSRSANCPVPSGLARARLVRHKRAVRSACSSPGADVAQTTGLRA